MKVSISGSHSTGKTVLAEACYSTLNSQYPGQVSFIKEVARQVIAEGLPLNQDATIDSYTHYILAQLRAERGATTKHVISDRSLVDLLAYIRANADSRIPSYFTGMLEEILWLETRYFDVYCYIPIEFPLVMDDVRSEQEDYRALVDRMLTGVLCEYNVCVETVTGSVEQRRTKTLRIFENARGWGLD